MKIEDQVCSLELAKKLKDLGVKQEYQAYDAYWVKLSNGEWWLMFLETQEDPPSQTPFEHCRAFTVAELGEMFPIDCDYFSGKNWNDEQFGCSVHRGRDWCFREEAKTEADARAKMLIYLIENNLITV